MDEVGKRLRSARIEKGYTLDDLQQITKIQKRYLLALEQGKFDELPGDFYVRGFIKQYATTVGLDGEEIVKDYEEQTPATRPRDYGEPVAEGKTRTAQRSGNSVGKWLHDNFGKVVIGVVALVIIASLYFYVARLANQPKTQIPDQSSKVVSSKKSDNSSSAKQSSAESSSKSSSKKSELSITQATGNTNTYNVKDLPSGDNKLTVSASKRAWVMVTVTGGTPSTWQAELAEGEDHEVTIPTGVTSIAVRMGNAAETKLKINNKEVPLPADATSVQNYTLNFESNN